MSLATVIFWLVVLLTAGSALMVALARNILHAAFSLCLAFLGVAALYVFLHADFVAAVQLIVYVGGILVLIMFAVMFSARVTEDTAENRRSWLAMAAGGLAATGLFTAFCLLTVRLEAPLNAANPHAQVPFRATVSPDPTPQLSARPTPGAPASPGAQPPSNTPNKEGAQAPVTAPVLGHMLLGKYLLPFEFVSVLILAALIGAVVLVRKEIN